ncbi:bile acid:sodium symporter family protein [Mesorhizobium sp. DCY119]|uniref:bile acid:sodium symporter family protein n=1 Tax=Mesorhizobium sp. DCY119 TaxID=2108445 RepID=UPI000E74220C|nr:bile acid:sodium symporter family protein [Mesorhizobium sp. DCY119]RJG39857.1 bile acid:sodium symporter [Mesorhizobium sp. DCY119]
MKYLKGLGVDNYMLLLIATVAVAFLLPVHGIGTVVVNYITYWAVALLFFLYGAKLDSASVRKGLMNWRVQGWTFCATYVFLPALGVGLAFVVSPFLGTVAALGFVYLAVLPSTVQSSIAFTSIAGGNVPAAICAASLSNLTGVFLTPALVAILLSQSGQGVSPDAIIKIATQILLPFIVGQFLRPWIGATVRHYRALTLGVDRGAILLIVYSAFSAGTMAGLWSKVPPTSLLLIVLFVMIFLAIAIVIMVLVGKFTGMPPEDRLVLLFCGSTKSLATGLPMATALFSEELVGAIVLPLMIYHMSQLLVCAFISQRRSKKIVLTA